MTMKVLSLFDGMSCGRIALERAGIGVDLYLASEVDKYAIQVSEKNYPDIVQIGDVTRVNKHNQHKLPEIDLLIGGSPCQGFSFAGKGLNFDDPRSKLFFEFVRLLQECRPKYFLLENVRMKQEFQDVISEHLGVQPIAINSSLVSAQNRYRLYWTNIPNVTQPEDKGIVLKDIIEGPCFRVGRIVGRKINPETGKRDDDNPELKSKQRVEIREDDKSGTLTTAYKDNALITYMSPKTTERFVRYGMKFVTDESLKSRCISAREYEKNGRQGDYVKVEENPLLIRKLLPVECERLQTVPDGYTEGVSNTQRYKMLGNGWTVDVIAHILKGLK